MRVTIFTSNQPRHLSLIRSFVQAGADVSAVCECTTLFPGAVADYYPVSPVMKRYFERVRWAEREVFGEAEFVCPGATVFPLFLNDLSKLPLSSFEPALNADYYVVFGASYIKGDLCEHLVKNRALNIHLGTSPYYRGSSCNFWALYDKRPDYVGATIHLLSKGLDSGPVLFHAFPAAEAIDPFLLGMKAVKAAHLALCEVLNEGSTWESQPVPQDRARELRYTKGVDFTDEVAAAYLAAPPTPQDVFAGCLRRDPSAFVRPKVLQF